MGGFERLKISIYHWISGDDMYETFHLLFYTNKTLGNSKKINLDQENGEDKIWSKLKLHKIWYNTIIWLISMYKAYSITRV